MGSLARIDRNHNDKGQSVSTGWAASLSLELWVSLKVANTDWSAVMIDRESRKRLGEALTHLLAGTITNCQFNELSPKWESADRAVQTIGAFYAELCMDEREYRLTGAEALNGTDEAMADRCRLFLQTDREYEWPEAPSMAGQAAVVGASVFLVLPLGVVLLIAAVAFWEPMLGLAGLACLGLSGCALWWWFRKDNWPEWRAYWASGEREFWPFLHQVDFEQARKGFAENGSAS